MKYNYIYKDFDSSWEMIKYLNENKVKKENIVYITSIGEKRTIFSTSFIVVYIE